MSRMCAPVRGMVEGVKPSKMVFFLAKMCVPQEGVWREGNILPKVVFLGGKNVCTSKGYGQRERQFSGLTLLMVIF